MWLWMSRLGNHPRSLSPALSRNHVSPMWVHSAFLQVSESMPSRMFSFLNPLAVEIWLYVFGTYIVVSLTIWVVARFSPYEWSEPNPCDAGVGGECDCSPPSTVGDCQAATALLVIENDFTLANSLWFTIGTLMQQGSDLNPKVVPWSLVRYSYRFITIFGTIT